MSIVVCTVEGCQARVNKLNLYCGLINNKLGQDNGPAVILTKRLDKQSSNKLKHTQTDKITNTSIKNGKTYKNAKVTGRPEKHKRKTHTKNNRKKNKQAHRLHIN